MEKEEIKKALERTGAIHRFDRKNDLWKQAFDLYGVSQGRHLSMKCSKCVNKVKEWLLR